MELKRIAVLFGGNSNEYEVSLESAHAVITHLNREKYEVIPVEMCIRDSPKGVSLNLFILF